MLPVLSSGGRALRTAPIGASVVGSFVGEITLPAPGASAWTPATTPPLAWLSLSLAASCSWAAACARSDGVSARPLHADALAPAFSSSSQTVDSPRLAARWRGVLPCASAASVDKPLSSRSLTILSRTPDPVPLAGPSAPLSAHAARTASAPPPPPPPPPPPTLPRVHHDHPPLKRLMRPRSATAAGWCRPHADMGKRATSHAEMGGRAASRSPASLRQLSSGCSIRREEDIHTYTRTYIHRPLLWLLDQARGRHTHIYTHMHT